MAGRFRVFRCLLSLSQDCLFCFSKLILDKTNTSLHSQKLAGAVLQFVACDVLTISTWCFEQKAEASP